MSTIVHALARATRPDRGVTLLGESAETPPEFRSWPRIARGAWGRAERLRAAGVRPGDRVVLALPTGFAFVETFLGLLVLGAAPVPAYPPAALERAALALERIAHVARDAGATRCLTERSLLALLGGLAIGESGIREVRDAEGFAGEADPGPTAAAPGDLAFLQYTSGSTDDPKGVRVTHGGVVANCRAMAEAVGTHDGDVIVSWLPLFHDLGLVCSFLGALYTDLPLVLLPPQAFLLEPRRWLQAMSDYGGTLSQAPTFAYARCTKRVRGLDGLDLSRWRVALVTAEPVNAEIVETFGAKFAAAGFDPGALRPAYGLAESTAGVTFGAGPRFDRVDRDQLSEGRAVPAEDGVRVANLGAPLPGHQVRVVREHGAACADREVGLVEVAGPSLAAGYHGRPELDAGVFVDGWLRTFDLGYLVDGELHLCGREKELIVVRGRKYHPDDLERAALAVPGVRPGGVVAFGVYDDQAGQDDLVVVCEVPELDPAARAALIDAVSAAVGERSGLIPHEVALVPIGALPKTSSGKRQRRKTRALWASGALSGPKAPGWAALAAMVGRSGLGLVVTRVRGWRG